MYKVTCLYEGVTYLLHDPESEELRIYNDELETRDNEPGAFRFTVSFDHPYVDKIVGLSSDIRVYDNGEEIFRGRPIRDSEDLYRARTFQCEGELAFLYDSIQPRRELHNITPEAFFTMLLEEHNRQVGNAGPLDKTFQVGAVTVTDSNDSLYRYTNRETTLDDIQDKLIDRLGGHLRVRLENGVRYLDLLADVETVSNQPIQLGENLLDYAKDMDYTEIATACIPLGTMLEETEIDALDAYLTVADANNGSEIIRLDAAAERYGFICKILNLNNYTVPANLKAAGEKWLTDGQYADMTLELTAVDLHGLGYDMEPIRVNTKVRVLSEPHGMDRYFEVAKRAYHLTQPELDTVIFGVSERRKTYTSAANQVVRTVREHTEQLRETITNIVDNVEEELSADFTQTATEITSRLDDVDGNGTTIEQSVQAITSRVEDAEGDISDFTQTATEITSRLNDADGNGSTLEQMIQSIIARVENAEGDVSEIAQTVDGISLSVSTVTENGEVYARLLLKIGDGEVYGFIKMEGNVDVSGDISADALYAGYGEIANLAVDQLITSRRIVKYLSGDNSDDNFIRAYQQNVEWVTGSATGGSAQATNPNGAPLFWPVDVSGLSRGSDGYPVNAQNERIFTTTTPTAYPVMVYSYTEAVKRSVSFENVNGVYSPIDRFGAGNADGNNQAWILKTADGFDIRYLTPDGKNIGVTMGADGKLRLDGFEYDADAIRERLGMASSSSASGGGTGFDLTQVNSDGSLSGLTVDADGHVDISGMRKVTNLNFSNIAYGYFSETLDGGVLNSYRVQRDASGRITKITDASGHETTITWNG